jgi:signal transduction histidine kinase
MNNETASSADFKLRIELQDEVLTEWTENVRAHVNRAEGLATPVLINTLPMFYKHLAALSTPGQVTYDRSTLALEHGGERARMTSIDVQGIAHEYQLFRRVLFEVWARAGIVVGPEETARINAAIDDAIRDSISGFVLRETSYREQFFATLTHDLRTPLGTASIAADLIQHSDSSERIHELAELIKKQHSLMGQMITDLLDTMALETGHEKLHMDDVDLYGLVEEIIQNAELTSGREFLLNGPAIVGRWSRQSLRRAIENLVNNAIKYSEKDSPITITLEQIDSRVVVTVSNFGTQIPEDQIAGLFQIFRRGSRASTDASNWGVGLAYVRSVAERHGGSIVVASNARETSFVFDIPLDPEPLIPAVPAAPAAPGAHD